MSCSKTNSLPCQTSACTRSSLQEVCSFAMQMSNATQRRALQPPPHRGVCVASGPTSETHAVNLFIYLFYCTNVFSRVESIAFIIQVGGGGGGCSMGSFLLCHCFLCLDVMAVLVMSPPPPPARHQSPSPHPARGTDGRTCCVFIHLHSCERVYRL